MVRFIIDNSLRPVKVRAFWDEEARVWVATSEDVPGLVTEADTIEKLVEKLKVLIPELLDHQGSIKLRGTTLGADSADGDVST